MENVISFPKLGLEFAINSVAFEIAGIKIYWYGVLIALGVILALVYGFYRSKQVGIDSDRMIDVVIAGIVGGVIGARIYYVVFSFDDFKDNILSVFDIRQGGLAIYGGIIGAVLVGWLFCRIRKVKFFPMLDIAGMGFLIGQGIGRWGNFVNVEAFGCQTELPWGMSSENIVRVLSENGAVAQDGFVLMAHPTFLYESLWCLIGFVLLNFYFKHRRYDGEIFLMYVIWYGLERFIVEGLRMDSLWMGPFRVSQLLSAIVVIAAAAVMIVVRYNIYQNKDNPDYLMLYVNTAESRELLAEKQRRIDKKKLKKSQDESFPSVEDMISEGDTLPEEPEDNDESDNDFIEEEN